VRVLAVVVCLSVTSRCPTETAKRRITQTTPCDSAGTLVFWCRKSRQNSNRVTSNGGDKCRCGRCKLATFDAKRCQLTSSSVTSLKFITLSVHLICLQHVRHETVRRAGLPATARPCLWLESSVLSSFMKSFERVGWVPRRASETDGGRNVMVIVLLYIHFSNKNC